MFHSFITFEEEILHQGSVITTIPLETKCKGVGGFIALIEVGDLFR